MMRLGESLAALALLGALGVGGWLLATSPLDRAREHDIVLALDPSGSAGPTSMCDDVERIVGQLVADPTPLSLVLIASTQTGGVERVGQWELRLPRRLLEGAERAGAEREAFVRAVVTGCHSIAQPTKISPVFALVESGLAYLDGAECSDPRVQCRLVLRTDGRESVDRRLRRAIALGRSPTPSPRLRADDIVVTVCGLAEGRGASGPPLAAVKAALSAEFVDSSSVGFSAGCAVFGGGR